MSEINYFKKFVLCSGDVVTDVDHLHIKRIHLEFLVSHLYIVIEDSLVSIVCSSYCNSRGDIILL
jgi:hypothetical protein